MDKVKLHLGCGEKYIPGFIHIDRRAFSHIDYIMDVDNLFEFNEQSVDMIYASHILEHFGRHEVIDVLKEWYRVLVYKGILRIAVPDFEAICRAYRTFEDMNLIMGPLHGGQDYKGNIHYVSFDFKYLSKLLEEVGFYNIHRYDWRYTIHKDYDDFSQSYLPHMDKKNGILISLNVEATK